MLHQPFPGPLHLVCYSASSLNEHQIKLLILKVSFQIMDMYLTFQGHTMWSQSLKKTYVSAWTSKLVGPVDMEFAIAVRTQDH